MLLDVIDGTSFKSNFDAIVPVYPISILSFISSDDVVFSLFVFCAISIFPSTSNISFLTYPVYVLYFILYHSPSSDKTSTSSSNDINVTTLDSVDASFLILTVS